MESDGSKQAEKDLIRCYRKLWKYIDGLSVARKKKDELAKLIRDVEDAVVVMESYCGN